MKTGIEKMVEWLEALPDGLYRRTEAVIIARSLAAEEKAIESFKTGVNI